MLTVVEKEYLTPNMIRITFQGDELGESFAWAPGGYIKLTIPGEKTAVRTYTIRNHYPELKRITIDFAIHQPAGAATSWALQAVEGDQIAYRGPGRLKIDPTAGDWFIFAADMAAIPAAISVMESLDANAKGYAFLEITDEKDRQELSIPAGIKVQWLHHPDPKIKSKQQLEAIQKLAPLDGVPNVFVAGELSTIREIKQYFSGEGRFKNSARYISSYWKIGLNEEEHKQAKRRELFG
ncbi:MAG: siderophore-interacting protein [Bacteroidota bacterium]